MRLVYYDIPEGIEIYEDRISYLVIEDQRLLMRFIRELYDQYNGLDGKIALFEGDHELKISKNVELIYDFLSFDINEKKIISKINSILENIALDEDNYLESMNITASIEKYIYHLSEKLPYSFECNGIGISAVIKMASVSIVDDSKSDIDRIYLYMSIVQELLGEKLFVLVNLSSYYTDDEIQLLCETLIKHRIKALIVDNKPVLNNEFMKRRIIDKDLCVI